MFFGIALLPFGVGALPLGVALIGTIFNWGRQYRYVWVRGSSKTVSPVEHAHNDLERSMQIIGLILLIGMGVLILTLVLK